MIEIKEKNEEFEREKLHLQTVVNEKDQKIEEQSSYLT